MKKIAFLLACFTIFVSCEEAEFKPRILEEPMTDDMQATDDEDPPLVAPVSAPCENGLAGMFYSCSDYDLVYSLDLGELGGARGNDCWGWTDPDTGKEYAIMGLDNGTSFIDITDPMDIKILGKLPTQTSSSTWRDIKVYQNHAYIVSEAEGHGMQVFDLTRLRNVQGTDNTFDIDNIYSGFGRAHNIVINEDSGYAYAVGTTTYNGGPHFINIQDPIFPAAAGGYEMDEYSHDAQVVTYNGPDTEHVGKEILVGSNENEIVIVDITDKNNPIKLSSATYGSVAYTHQGWFTEDHAYFLVGDELDETSSGFNSRTLVYDFTDLDDPDLISEYFGPTAAIDHNGYVKDNLYYLSNYTAGLRVLDISDIANGVISEVGHFDSYQPNNQANFNGAWSVYPYFESGHILISDINGGLFIVKKKQ